MRTRTYYLIRGTVRAIFFTAIASAILAGAWAFIWLAWAAFG